MNVSNATSKAFNSCVPGTPPYARFRSFCALTYFCVYLSLYCVICICKGEHSSCYFFLLFFYFENTQCEFGYLRTLKHPRHFITRKKKKKSIASSQDAITVGGRAEADYII